MKNRTPPFPDYAVFGNVQDEHRRCCQCCAGYCHTGTEPAVPGMLYAFTVRSVDYVTDRYVAVRADLVTVRTAPTHVDVRKDVYLVPASKPPTSTARLVPERMHTLTAAGFDICGDDNAHNAIQDLYLGGEHVGWVMALHRVPADNGLHEFTLDDLPTLREIAKSLPVIENDHPIMTAARMLSWERERARRRAPRVLP